MVSQIALAAGLTAAINFLAIGAGLIFADRGFKSVKGLGAVGALIAAVAMATIWAGDAVTEPWRVRVELVEFVLTLSAGPVFLLVVSALADRPFPYFHALWPAVAVGILLYAAAAGAPDIRAAVWVQISYSTAAALVVALQGKASAKLRRLKYAKLLLAALLVLHLAQLTRMLGPRTELLALLVPLVMSMLAAGFVVGVVAMLAPRGRASARGKCQLSLADLRVLIAHDNAFLKTDYRLSDLAAAAGVSAPALSSVINTETGAGFVSFLNSERLDYARGLLKAPGEARTSVEAIALMSGFRSRSAFYRAFAQAYGMTPAAYRKAATHVS